MSSNTETFTFDRPETIDDATYSRIVFIRPLELAVQPIIDHNMELIGTVRRLRPWYRGEHDAMEPELLSTLLDPDANHACDMLKAFIAIVKRYNPGEFPAHCCKMRELVFTTRYLIRELEKCFDSPAFTNAVTQLGHLIFTWSAPNAGMYSFFDWVTRLDTRLECLIRSFADIAEACRPTMPPPTSSAPCARPSAPSSRTPTPPARARPTGAFPRASAAARSPPCATSCARPAPTASG